MQPTLPDDAIDTDFQQRLGRNLLVFQRIETNLKRLMSLNRITIHIPVGSLAQDFKSDSLLESLRLQAEKRRLQSLGILKNDYFDEVLSSEEDEECLSMEGHYSVRFSFRMEENADTARATTKRWNALVEERNQMVHHLLERLGTGDHQTISLARTWLDELHKRALDVLHELRSQLQCLIEGQQAQFDYLRSPEAARDFERAWLQQSPLATCLMNLSQQIQRTDGWTVFDTANSVAREQIPDELANLKVRYGYSKLRTMAEATGLFEFREELTPRNGKRLLYRLHAGSGLTT